MDIKKILADNDRLRTDNEALKVEIEMMTDGTQLMIEGHAAEVNHLKRQLEEMTADRDSMLWVRKMAQPDDAANYDAIMKSLVDENGRQEAVEVLKKITTRLEAEELAAKIAISKTR